MELHHQEMASPLGPLQLVASERGLCALGFADRVEVVSADLRRRFGEVQLVRAAVAAGSALTAYFAGDLAALEGVEVDTAGSEFQAAVWRRLRSIPAGTTLSYAELATALGRPTATRAVGTANASNPVAIVVPCHRVIASDGGLGGYGGGLERKRWLLEHERALANLSLF